MSSKSTITNTYGIEVPEGQVPKYRLLERCFLEPHLLDPDSVITTWAEPHNGWRPLNPAARLELERWYDKPAFVYDDKFKKVMDKNGEPELQFPNRRWRFVNESGRADGATPIEYDLVAAPRKKAETIKSLQELTFERKPTDQRPGPAVAMYDEDPDEETAPTLATADTVIDAVGPRRGPRTA
jgi:hypothetical protein